jgi:hypothetical protein
LSRFAGGRGSLAPAEQQHEDGSNDPESPDLLGSIARRVHEQKVKLGP